MGNYKIINPDNTEEICGSVQAKRIVGWLREGEKLIVEKL